MDLAKNKEKNIWALERRLIVQKQCRRRTPMNNYAWVDIGPPIQHMSDQEITSLATKEEVNQTLPQLTHLKVDCYL